MNESNIIQIIQNHLDFDWLGQITQTEEKNATEAKSRMFYICAVNRNKINKLRNTVGCVFLFCESTKPHI